MKHVAIIGAGICGLRAALELSQAGLGVTVFEKSRSVGGRVATRRYGTEFVNHGATAFDGAERVLDADPVAHALRQQLQFPAEATALPKALKELALGTTPAPVQLQFNQRAKKVTEDGQLELIDGPTFHFDHILITSPVPQTRDLLGSHVLPEVAYDKRVLFIGSPEGVPERIEMSADWSEEFFERDDDELRARAEYLLARGLSALELKKWRYAQVRTGHPAPYQRQCPRITLAGDAFDEQKEHHLGAAWLSGLAAATEIKESLL